MPIYEYQCARCGATREVLHKISESPQLECAQCEDSPLQRMVSAAAFRLKGGGWYETDFKSDKEKQRNLAGDSGGDSTPKTTTGASDAGKPAAKSEAKPSTPPPAAPSASAG